MIDLKKEKESAPVRSEICVGLGWYPNQRSWNAKKDKHCYDLDLSAFMLGADGKLVSDDFFVFYNNTDSPDGAVFLQSDNRTGVGAGDDETLVVDLSIVDPRVTEIVFVASVFEPKVYDESGTDTNKNNVYHKKRFYFLFTDSRLQGNIYQRIVASVDLKKYPNVGVYHMSTSHPVVMTPDQTTTPSPILAAKVEGRGGYEIQDWQVDWESIMKNLGAGAVDEKTGQPLPNGAPLITGLNIDREVYGCFRIKNIKLKVYDIDNAYFDYYTSKSAHTRAGVLTGKLSDYELQNAFTFDSKLFKKTGRVAILLDPSFDPSMLTGDPFNYIKIDVCVDGVENVFENNEKFFYFDSVDNSAKTNTSLSESVKQCLVDPSIQHSMDGTVIYSIYIKSNKN
jgi:stress response protein SCP2